MCEQQRLKVFGVAQSKRTVNQIKGSWMHVLRTRTSQASVALFAAAVAHLASWTLSRLFEPKARTFLVPEVIPILQCGNVMHD
jgi:hypothetical protein